ncbi:FAD-binding protein [Conexibacter sp. JD483]|uniref:FAD-binding oxidoreductase n=1 Tax=unclassified Conexibacter TaxID=2627773 RepID=UPI0027157B9C|nr:MULTISPECIES: FAD-binding protein [unclassified Conexibacter]MDO8185536.1 FAD-binding protein [Conexibacter sp. CPCC 205706]MDO8197277.1 FAD-binding protein [Conexibacter sp. CPCC 205762]MDR9370773.1 FAD-binding protein [Conexibacter sp. JD483]
MSATGLGALREAVRGSVTLPGDDGWDAARQPFNLAADQRPAAVVHAADGDDVAAAVAAARAAGLRVAPQGTGHGAGALGPLDDALLLRTTRLDSVSIDVERHTARVGAGAIWRPVAEQASPHGLAALHGSSPTVGIAGYTLGGGLGWLSRLHGLASESVRAIELVTADGRALRADADSEPELFWALRGGGGGFGVVTALEFDLHPLPHAYGGGLFWPGADAEAVLSAYAAWAPELPDTVSTTVRLLRVPPLPTVPEALRGRTLVDVGLVVADTEAAGRELVAPLLAGLPSPLIDRLAPLPPAALAQVHGDPEEPLPGCGHHTLLEALPAEAIAALLEVAGPQSGSPLVSVELRALGGALARRTPGAGALGTLDAAFALYAVGVPFTPSGDDLRAVVEERLEAVVTALRPWAAPTGFLNFADRPGGDSAALFAADTHARLLAVKRAVDPEGLIVAGNPLTLPA